MRICDIPVADIYWIHYHTKLNKSSFNFGTNPHKTTSLKSGLSIPRIWPGVKADKRCYLYRQVLLPHWRHICNCKCWNWCHAKWASWKCWSGWERHLVKNPPFCERRVRSQSRNQDHLENNEIKILKKLSKNSSNWRREGISALLS